MEKRVTEISDQCCRSVDETSAARYGGKAQRKCSLEAREDTGYENERGICLQESLRRAELPRGNHPVTIVSHKENKRANPSNIEV